MSKVRQVANPINQVTSKCEQSTVVSFNAALDHLASSLNEFQQLADDIYQENLDRASPQTSVGSIIAVTTAGITILHDIANEISLKTRIIRDGIRV